MRVIEQATVPGSAAAADDPGLAAILRDPAALLEAVQRTSGEYIVVVDRGGIIRTCNRVDDGFRLEDVVGHSLVRFTVPESSAALTAAVERVFAGGGMETLETTVRRLDGVSSYFSLRLSPLRHEGRVVAALVCCENIRPLKDSEQEVLRERNTLRRLLEIQERERRLVSYDIHDGLCQYLTAAVMHLQAHEHAQPAGGPRHELDEGLRLLAAAVTEARRLIAGLRPPALDELGIVAAIESLVTEARTAIPRVDFTARLPGPRLPAELETVIFRIAQEALTNVRRHAAAGRVEVLLDRTATHVLVTVRDDGRGFDPAAVPEDRFGLEGLRQRCRLLGGEPRITTAPGRGTAIEVALPIPAAD